MYNLNSGGRCEDLDCCHCIMFARRFGLGRARRTGRFLCQLERRRREEGRRQRQEIVRPGSETGGRTAAADRAEFAKEVDTYTEYALATTAEQPGMEPSKTVELVDQLEAQNPKSKYLDLRCLAADVTALSSLAQSAAAKSPDRALADANKLIAVGTRAKPEGAPDADWERIRAAALGNGYYLAGAIYAQKQSWVDCDRELKDALPYISKEPARMGPAEFYLGLCNYQFGRLTQDRSRLMAAQKYSEASAAIPGPMQQQAARNANAIKLELAGPTKR